MKQTKKKQNNQVFQTGSHRDSQEGKGRFDLLPTRALKALAVHFQKGAIKYGERNWELGQPVGRYLDSALRHTFSHLEGQRNEDHLTAAVWNLICALETEARIKQGLLPKSLNNLPK